MSSASVKRRRSKYAELKEQFVPYHRSMLESPAFQVLSLSGQRVLARIGLEWLRHAGLENGYLQVTYSNFIAYNIDEQSIRPALAECEALGFLRTTKKGRAGNGTFRQGTLYRLTYLYTQTPHEPPSHDWKRIATIDDAKAIAKTAREEYARKRPKRKRRSDEAAAARQDRKPRKRKAADGSSPTLFDVMEVRPLARTKLRVVK
jgi:hypothetical protein